MRNTQEMRRIWLKSVMIDAGEPLPAKISRRPMTKRLSLARRLEKLHRMRAGLEPPRFMDGKLAP